MMLYEGSVYFYLNGQRRYAPTPMRPGWDTLGTCQLSIGSDFGQENLYGAFSNVAVSDQARYVDVFGVAMDSFPLTCLRTCRGTPKSWCRSGPHGM